MNSISPWLIRLSPNLTTGPRVLCLPYAGAGANPWRAWARRLPGIELWAALLPGREARFKETAQSRIEPSVEGLREAIAVFVDRPLLLFGHSMGALLALELARRLSDDGLDNLCGVIVSGRPAPDTFRQQPPTWDLPLPALRERLRELGGAPEAVLANDELMELLLPTLRADLEAAETWKHIPAPPLTAPMVALFGCDDPTTPRAYMEGWREQTSSFFDLRAFPGGHFFLFDHADKITRIISELVGQS